MPDNSQKNIILQYKGQIDYDIIGDLIQELKDDMKSRNVRFGLYKKVLTLMIETLENVIRYRENLDHDDPVLLDHPPSFIIYKNDTEYEIEVSNAIRNKDAAILRKRLEELNSMDRKAIKDLYKATITNGQFSEHGGAGLGMIEMAKLADKKLDFSFADIDRQYSSFRLRLTVKSSLIKK